MSVAKKSVSANADHNAATAWCRQLSAPMPTAQSQYASITAATTMGLAAKNLSRAAERSSPLPVWLAKVHCCKTAYTPNAPVTHTQNISVSPTGGLYLAWKYSSQIRPALSTSAATMLMVLA